MQRCAHQASPGAVTGAAPQQMTLRDGRQVTLRALQLQDSVLLQAFFAGLCAATRRCRFHGAVNGVSSAQAQRMSQVNPAAGIALVATHCAAGGAEQVVAEARYMLSTTHAAHATHGAGQAGVAEFAITVGDHWAGQGLAQQLMQLLAASARRAGLRLLRGEVLAHNQRMLVLMQRCGFSLSPHPCDHDLLLAEFDLRLQGAPASVWRAGLQPLWSGLGRRLPALARWLRFVAAA